MVEKADSAEYKSRDKNVNFHKLSRNCWLGGAAGWAASPVWMTRRRRPKRGLLRGEPVAIMAPQLVSHLATGGQIGSAALSLALGAAFLARPLRRLPVWRIVAQSERPAAVATLQRREQP